jgi:Spy/CpxP family protein refolding chaperone
MKRAAYILAVALAAPVAGSAQAPAAGAQGPAERLLAHRAELALTADQVQKLEAIDKRQDQQDKEVIAKLEALRGKPVGQPLRMRELAPADREKLQANRNELQPLMQQLRTSHQAAIADVRGVLTSEQSSRAGQYLYQGPGQGQGRGPMAGANLRGQGQGRGPGAGRAAMRGRGNMQGNGRGMMRHTPGTGQGFRGGRGA